MPSIRITKWFGRLGNNCLQLAHAVHLARELGIREVEHPPHPLFKGRKIDLGVSFGSHPGLSGEFFYEKSLIPHATPLSISGRKHIFRETLWPRFIGRDCLGQPMKSLLKQESTLVIHIRSGDVFSAKPHADYVQPPLWFYRTIIEGNDWSDILLVSEDSRNPVINKLCADYPKIRIHRMSLAEDFSVLCKARNLLGSYGTFTHAAFCFNANILRYWIPGYLKDGANFAQAFPVQVTIVQCPDYIRVGQWINSAEQRQIMLDYTPPLTQQIDSTNQKQTDLVMEPLLVISPGGMACTFTIQSLRRIGFPTNCPKDSDGIKHCPDPNDPRLEKYRHNKKLYIWNHPLTAILILHRRGWLQLQQRKLRQDRGPFPGNLEDIWRQNTIAQCDITGIAQHFEQWFTSNTPEIFWLDFRQIEQQRLALSEFLGCSSGELQDIVLRPRHSEVPPEIPHHILELYDELDKQVCLRMADRQQGLKICHNHQE